MTDDGLRAAVRNNADWCAIVCRSHGIGGRFTGDAWVADGPTPPLYPDAVTLEPTAEPGGLHDLVGARPGATIKDSFASLDLAPFGWRVLFDASWIERRAGGVVPA